LNNGLRALVQAFGPDDRFDTENSESRQSGIVPTSDKLNSLVKNCRPSGERSDRDLPTGEDNIPRMKMMQSALHYVTSARSARNSDKYQ
jgi:hypothetical protein